MLLRFGPQSAQTPTNMKISLTKNRAQVGGSQYSALQLRPPQHERAHPQSERPVCFQAAAIARSSAESALGVRRAKAVSPVGVKTHPMRGFKNRAGWQCSS